MFDYTDIEDVTQNIMQRWGNACGDMAYDYADMSEMDAFLSPKMWCIVKRLKRKNVLDIVGALADELYNDAEMFRDMIPDWFSDYDNFEDDDIAKKLLQEYYFNDTVVDAMNDLLNIKAIEYQVYEPPEIKIPKKLPDPPKEIRGVMTRGSKIVKLHGTRRFKANDKAEYTFLKGHWYILRKLGAR